MLKPSIFLTFIAIILSQQIPVFDYPYQVRYDQTIIRDESYHIKGQEFYDPINKRQRIDRTNGQYNLFCGSILPGVDTPCTSLVTEGKRWMIFSQRSQCCLCCNSQPGCGILSPDWLKGAEYQGQFSIDGISCQKWRKTGAFGQNYLYVTKDGQIPRRLDEGGAQIADYDINSFIKMELADSIFAVPSYCMTDDKPNICPSSSFCAQIPKIKSLSLQ